MTCILTAVAADQNTVLIAWRVILNAVIAAVMLTQWTGSYV